MIFHISSLVPPFLHNMRSPPTSYTHTDTSSINDAQAPIISAM